MSDFLISFIFMIMGVFIGYGLAEYQRHKFHKRRRTLLEELTRISQELGLYNTEPEGDKECLTKK